MDEVRSVKKRESREASHSNHNLCLEDFNNRFYDYISFKFISKKLDNKNTIII